MMTPRDYQTRALDDLWAWFNAHAEGNPIVDACVGAGKSYMIALLTQRAIRTYPGTRIVVLVHQTELLDQNVEKMRLVWPSADVGVFSAKTRTTRRLDHTITFATTASVYKYGLDIGRVDLVLCDECFVGETIIATPSGPKRIDQVRCGDAVYNQLGIGIVMATSARNASDLYRLEFDDGSEITCTGGHPFFTRSGWKKAEELEVGESFFSIEGMRLLWSGIQAVDEAVGLRGGVIGLPGATVREAEVLLDIVQQESGEPDEQQPGSHEDARHDQSHKAQANQARRERAIAALASASSVACARGWLGIGGSSADECEARRGIPDTLQDRHREHVNDDRHRAGRGVARVAGKAGPGREENGVLNFPRLVNISRHQQPSTRTVFNLHVSGHPSYFANGKAVHNCHLIPTADRGMWRTFINSVQTTNPDCRVIGWTGTPFRGDGTWLTTGKDPLFQAVASKVGMTELLELGFLSPIVPVGTNTKIDADDVEIVQGDYVIDQLAQVSDRPEIVEAACDEICRLAAERRKWFVYCVTVEHCLHVRDALRARGVKAEMVTGKTPKTEREETVAALKAGRIRCIVNVATMTTGIDVPDLDCIALLRATKSPVLYVQIAGRGMRIAPGKEDCMWLDFTDTSANLGPVDVIKGRAWKPRGAAQAQAPYKVCEKCGSQNPTAALVCSSCGATFPEPERINHGATVLAVPVLSSQLPKRSEHAVDRVSYALHQKSDGLVPTLRVEYWSGVRIVAREWVSLGHTGYARMRAEQWWQLRSKIDSIPGNANEAMEWLDYDQSILRTPSSIETMKDGKYDVITSYHWNDAASDRVADQPAQAGAASAGSNQVQLQRM